MKKRPATLSRQRSMRGSSKRRWKPVNINILKMGKLFSALNRRSSRSIGMQNCRGSGLATWLLPGSVTRNSTSNCAPPLLSSVVGLQGIVQLAEMGQSVKHRLCEHMQHMPMEDIQPQCGVPSRGHQKSVQWMARLMVGHPVLRKHYSAQLLVSTCLDRMVNNCCTPKS